MLSRRALLIAPLLSLEPGDSIRRDAVLTLPSGAVFHCPPRRARLLAMLHTDEPIAAIAFGLDPPGATQNLLALVGPRGQLWALEMLDWHGEGNASISTRPSLMPDRRHIKLERDAARRTGVTWKRETWTDYLLWTGGMLHDAPARPVLAGTWQDHLATWRAAIAAQLGAPCGAVPQSILSAFCSPDASPFAK